MTCIVGLVDNGNVYIGGDSAGVAGLNLTVRADEKVFRNGPFLMGFTSSFRMGQLLRYAFKPPLHDPEMDVDRYMATVFIDAVRQCLKDGGYAKKTNEEESGGNFLVGYQGQLFEIDDDYQVAKPLDGYVAVGCGAQIARGAMFASEERQPETRVLMALDAAERFSAGVRRPFLLMTLPGVQR